MILYLHQKPAELFKRLDKTLISDFPDDKHIDGGFVPGKSLAGWVLDVPGTQKQTHEWGNKKNNNNTETAKMLQYVRVETQDLSLFQIKSDAVMTMSFFDWINNH